MSKELSTEKIRLLRAEVERLEASGVVLPPTLAALLAEVEGAHGSELPLRERFQQELTEFEVSHPRLTAIANDIFVALGGMGI